MDLDDYARHSPYTDPGPHAAALRAVETDPESLHRAVTRTVVHYRSGPAVTERQRADVDLRWVSSILDAAASRAPGPLDAERPDACRVGGCCRDHSLLAVAVLREHGVPARVRAGFAGYFHPTWHHDHVVAERWDGTRWVRFDPELGADDFPFDVHDLPRGTGAPFETAAEVWLAHRDDGRDLAAFGVDPAVPHLAGPAFVQGYVLLDLAARTGTELLLWDVWGAMVPPGVEPDAATAALTDTVARLTVAADAGGAGGAAADAELARLWAADGRLRPGDVVESFSPSAPPARVDLRSRARVPFDVPGGPGPTPSPQSAAVPVAAPEAAPVAAPEAG